MVVDGVHHWRAYSLTSDPGRPTAASASRRSSSTRARCRRTSCAGASPGAIVRLGGVEGTFVLPDPLPEKLLFISAGSGITPIMSMLRALDRARRARRRRPPPLGAHRGRASSSATELREIDERHARLPAPRAAHRRARPHDARRTSTSSAPTGASARRSPPAPASCSTRSSSTGRRGRPRRACTWSASSPIIGGDAERGRGRHGQLPHERRRGRLRRRRRRSSSPARRPARRCRSAAGWASATPASGSSAPARSATCAPARSPAQQGEMVRTCVNAPEGPVEIELT